MIKFYGLEFDIIDDKILLNGHHFVELQIAGENHSGAHVGSKQFLTSEWDRLKYVSHTLNENELVIWQKSELVQVQTIFNTYSNTNAVRVYNKVKNISGNEICIESISSLMIFGLGTKGIESDLNFYRFTNSWHEECQPRISSFFELGLFPGNSGNMKRISGSNSGGWSTKEELPQAIVEDKEENAFLMFQIESNGSWYYEIGESCGELYLNAGGPNCDFNQWSKKLKNAECFETVKVAMCKGESLNDVLAQMTMYRRAITRKCLADENLPTIFNEYMHLSWDNPDESKTRAIAVAAKKVGIDYYVIDCGWHNEEKSVYNYVGHWRESNARFPSGIKKTIDYIHSLGMKAGLWIEPESLGYLCKDMIEYYGAEAIFHRNGKPVLNMGRYQLDFRNEKVKNFIQDVFTRLIEQYGTDYIKLDYNQCCGAGTETNSDSLGDGLLSHNRAYIALFEALMQKYPNVIIEACASGGQRMDYETLRVFPIQSTSDQTDYKKYTYIAGNILSAVLPEQAAVWSYPVSNYLESDYKAIAKKLTDDQIVYNMINSFLGRMHLASHIEYLSEKQLKLIKSGVEYMQTLNQYKVSAVPYFPMGFCDFKSRFVVSGFKSGNNIFLAVWNMFEPKIVKIPLNEININKIIIDYPKNSRTKFDFADKILQVNFTKSYQARFFNIKLQSL